MDTQNKLGCFLIGADTLLIECGDILLGRGHEIRGVISSTPRIDTWAQKAGIAVLDPKSDYRPALVEQRCRPV